MVARIIGTGSAVPENIVTNDDLSKVVDTNDEWISTRTGDFLRLFRIYHPLFCLPGCH